jgi:formate dehydrogenase maturation protein FdhE
MTPKQAVGFEYDVRRRRAEHLSKQYPFAKEVLDFYSHILAFQRNFRASMAPGVPSGSNWNAQASLTTRDSLDLTSLLPQFRGFLAMVEANAPAALSKSAHELSLLPTSSWIQVLQTYWKCAGINDDALGLLKRFLPQAFLQPHAELLGAQMPKPPALITVRVCPLCGSKPLLGVLRQEGDGGKRYLMCSFCLQEWEFRRIHCASCGEEDEKKLPVYVAEQFPHIRVEACDTCKIYTRTIDLTKDGNAAPLVDDLAAIPLTLWAEQQGFRRLQRNLLGT